MICKQNLYKNINCLWNIIEKFSLTPCCFCRSKIPTHILKSSINKKCVLSRIIKQRNKCKFVFFYFFVFKTIKFVDFQYYLFILSQSRICLYNLEVVLIYLNSNELRQQPQQ